MAHVLAIAKASFAASLIKPDPTSVPREGIAQFHRQLDEVLQLSSPANIQRCREWLVTNVVSSSGRRAALAKYLGALTESFHSDADANSGNSKGPVPHPRRTGLNLLYLIHDTLHDMQYHRPASQVVREFIQALIPCLRSVVRRYSSHKARDLCEEKLLDLLSIWQAEQYLDVVIVSELRTLATEKADVKDTTEKSPALDGPEHKVAAQFVMPESHGDAAVPFYDLPAATMVPHIIPSSTRPLNPQLIKPLHFSPGPAQKDLVEAVQAFLETTDAIYNQDQRQTRSAVDVSPLGQQIYRDNLGRSVDENRSYYGWSLQFCKAIKDGASIEDAMNDEKNQLVPSGTGQAHPLGGFGSRRFSSRSSRSSRSRSPSRSYSPPSPSNYENKRGHADSSNGPRPPNRSPPVDPRRRAVMT